MCFTEEFWFFYIWRLGFSALQVENVFLDIVSDALKSAPGFQAFLGKSLQKFFFVKRRFLSGLDSVRRNFFLIEIGGLISRRGAFSQSPVKYKVWRRYQFVALQKLSSLATF